MSASSPVGFYPAPSAPNTSLVSSGLWPKKPDSSELASASFLEPSISLGELLSEPKKVFQTLSPLKSITLFGAGLATSIGLAWFTRGLGQPTQQMAISLNALKQPVQKVERQTAILFQRGLESVVMMAMKYKPLQTRLKAYLGASVLGYALGSLAKGTQEVWVRREETQIRADLLHELKTTFQSSLKKKLDSDQQLQKVARHLLLATLQRHGVRDAAHLLGPNYVDVQNPYWRYPFEPVHFNKPIGMGSRPENTASNIQATPTRCPMKWVVYGLGLGSGLLYQGLNHVLKHGSLGPVEKSPLVKQSLMEITNAVDREALFLMGNNKILFAVLGLTAAARVGKLLVDGYREIEVTRQHAETERKYQRYNWLDLDPSFHSISENEALKGHLKRFDETLRLYPHLQLNRPALHQSVQSILSNIGRESAPRYFPMTPSVNLVPARS